MNKMIRSCVYDPLRNLGDGGVFMGQVVLSVHPGRRLLAAVMRQLYFIGTRSLVIIMTCGFFVGMVLALQGYRTLSTFGATNAVGTMLGLALYRELSPVLTALLFAGRAGTSVAAEIGLMKATDQITAMELMAVDPMERVVAPRFIAGVIAMPLLTILFEAMALLGGMIFAVWVMGVDSGIFWGNMQQNVDFYSDLVIGLYKSTIFGVIGSLIAVHAGFRATPTGEGIGSATTQTVVASAILVLMFDFILSSFLVV